SAASLDTLALLDALPILVYMTRHVCLAVGFALLLALSAFAQQGSTGAIMGTVSDPSGQVVPGAAVKVISELNGEERATNTNETRSEEHTSELQSRGHLVC